MRTIRLRKAEILWDLAAQAPRLHSAVKRLSPWTMSRLIDLRFRVPTAATCATFHCGDFFRLEGHHRSFYWQGPDEVIGFKGSEPLADDISESLKIMARPLEASAAARLEHFPLVENKVPLAVTTAEALSEARLTARFQSCYVDRYGVLARTPLPLLVIRWPASALQRLRSRLRPLLSSQARQAVDLLLDDGVACLIYRYPGRPMRAQHLGIFLDQMAVSNGDAVRRLHRLAELGGMCLKRGKIDPFETVERWLGLAARMLGLGFFPCQPAHRGLGQCLGEQNAVIDGGFTDMGSLLPMESVPDRRSFEEIFLLNWIELSDTVRRFLFGYMGHPAVRRPGASSPRRLRRIALQVDGFTVRELRRLIQEDGRAGLRLDPRLKRCFQALRER
jgi:hypothetical protein